jgi:hypothetical protein
MSLGSCNVLQVISARSISGNSTDIQLISRCRFSGQYISVIFVVLTSSTYSQQVSRLFIFHFITHRHTPQSVGLLWTRDRPVAETCT